MEAWLDLARGPLFTFALGVMILGLARLIIIQLVELFRQRHLLRRARWRIMLSDTMSWAVPLRHLVRGAAGITLVSILFHLGVVLVPLFLADHIALWERLLGVKLPRLTVAVADVLTLVAIACGLVLLGYRMAVPRARTLSRPRDYLVLILVLLPMVSGYLAAHPVSNPMGWQAMMLLHLLSGEALFVAVPFTKLSHVVLFPFERLSQVYWQLQPGAGELVARELWGEEVRV